MDHDALPLYPQVNPSGFIPRKENTTSPVAPAPTAPPMPMIAASLLGPENTVTKCQFCNASIRTAVKYSVTSRTHIAAALWCLACCLCCIPYASESAKNTDHYCPNCQRYLGTYQK